MAIKTILAVLGILSIFITIVGTLTLTLVSLKIMGDVKDHMVLPDDLNKSFSKLDAMMKVGIVMSIIGGIFSSLILPKVWKYRENIFEMVGSSESK